MNDAIDILIWGRHFVLDLIYQNYPGEIITERQKTVVSNIQDTDFSPALNEVITYIKKHNANELGEEEVSNIFKYVMPKGILIPRISGQEIFALMCNYKFDMEHGLAVLFENGTCKMVGSQDIIL